MSNARKLIQPSSTALVVIDLQEKLLPAIHGREEIVENTQKLLHLARALGLKTLVTTQYRKGLAGNPRPARQRRSGQGLVRLPGGRSFPENAGGDAAARRRFVAGRG